jgi:hypothetical protein
MAVTDEFRVLRVDPAISAQALQDMLNTQFGNGWELKQTLGNSVLILRHRDAYIAP